MAHFRDRDPVGDTVAHERPRSVLPYMDGTRGPVDRVARSGANFQMCSPNHLRDNHLLTTGIKLYGAVPNRESVSNPWKVLGEAR